MHLAMFIDWLQQSQSSNVRPHGDRDAGTQPARIAQAGLYAGKLLIECRDDRPNRGARDRNRVTPTGQVTE